MSCTIKRILQLQTAIQYGPIQVYDTNNQDITNSCMYSWSSDGVCWTNWNEYKSYLNIAKNIETDFYLRILLFGSFGKLKVSDLFTNCYNITLDTTNQFLEDFCGQENLFNPYLNMDCALLLQQQMADSVVCMFGIPIYYFKTKPNVETVDYTFKEYVMSNVESVKQIQLIVPDGTMPSSKPQFSDMDFDWEVDWDVEIGKTQFARAFGDTSFPNRGDFIYIPMMKRMWSVNSAYDEKNEGLMWRSTTWKLGLVKYNESTNISNEGFENLIDGFIVNKYEDVFGVLERNEQERQSGVTQLEKPTFAANNLTNIFLEDSIRKAMTKDTITIQDKQYNHQSMVVAKNQYIFNDPLSTIQYQKGICGENGVISFILSIPNELHIEEEICSINSKKQVIYAGEVGVYITQNVEIEFNGLKQQLQKGETYMVIIKWNRDNFTSELNVYKYIYPDGIPVYKIRPEMYQFDFNSPICEQSGEYNNDFIVEQPLPIYVNGWPVALTNIKYFNKSLNREEGIKESLKYTTTCSSCVINDVARKLDTGIGFAVR